MPATTNEAATDPVIDDLIGYSVAEATGFVQSLRTGFSPLGTPCPQFRDNPSPYTPNALAAEILDLVGDIRGRRIAVLFTVEFAAELRRRGFGAAAGAGRIAAALEEAMLLTRRRCPETEKLADLLGYEYTTLNKVKAMQRKFDIVLGNPPFEDAANDSPYTCLWPEFYRQGFDLLAEGGVMAMITPNSWAAPKDESRNSITKPVLDIIRDHAVHINMDECRRHFPDVGSAFTYSVVTKEFSERTTVRTRRTKFRTSPQVFCDCLIRDPDETSLSIVQKYRSLPMRPKDRSPVPKGDMIFDRERTAANADAYPYPVQFSYSTKKWCAQPHRHQYRRKVIWHNQATVDHPVYDDGEMAPSARGAVYLVDSKAEGENIVAFMRLRPIAFAIRKQRFHHGFLNIRVLSAIPDVDYAYRWTEADVCDLLELTAAEIEYINNADLTGPLH